MSHKKNRFRLSLFTRGIYRKWVNFRAGHPVYMHVIRSIGNYSIILGPHDSNGTFVNVHVYTGHNDIINTTARVGHTPWRLPFDNILAQVLIELTNK